MSIMTTSMLMMMMGMGPEMRMGGGACHWSQLELKVLVRRFFVVAISFTSWSKKRVKKYRKNKIFLRRDIG